MRLLESKLFSVILFLIFTAPIIPLVLGVNSNSSDSSEGNGLLHIIYLTLYGIVFVICLFQAKKFGEVLSRDFIFILLLLFIFSSAFWAYNNAFALQRVIALFGVTLVGYYWALRFKLNDLIKIGFYAYSIIAALSLILILFFPHIGLHQDGPHVGLPRGVFEHKNGLGANMMYGALFSIYFFAVAQKKANKMWAALVVCLSTILLVVSKSSTALLIFCVCLLLIFAVKVVNKMNRHLLISIVFMTLCVLIGVGILLMNNPNEVSSILGKNMTLTGRTFIWDQTWRAITEQPLLGYGYQSFWHINPKSLMLFGTIGWEAMYAHNGLLDTLIQLGFIGLSLFLISFLKSYGKAYVNIRRNEAFIYTFPFIILSINIFYNITETTIFMPNSATWSLFIYAALSSRIRSVDEAVVDIEVSNKIRNKIALS